jgi:hypothetical protein
MRIIQLVYLVIYGINVIWWSPFIIAGIALVLTGSVQGFLSNFIPEYIQSLLGFLIIPLLSFLCFIYCLKQVSMNCLTTIIIFIPLIVIGILSYALKGNDDDRLKRAWYYIVPLIFLWMAFAISIAIKTTRESDRANLIIKQWETIEKEKNEIDSTESVIKLKYPQARILKGGVNLGSIENSQLIISRKYSGISHIGLGDDWYNLYENISDTVRIECKVSIRTDDNIRARLFFRLAANRQQMILFHKRKYWHVIDAFKVWKKINNDEQPNEYIIEGKLIDFY